MAEMMRDIDEGVTMGSPIPNISENVEEGIEDNDVTFDQRRPQVQLRFNGDEDEGIRHRRRRINQFHRLVEDNDEYDNEGFEPKTMTQDEILHRHFKLAVRKKNIYIRKVAIYFYLDSSSFYVDGLSTLDDLDNFNGGILGGN